MRGVIIGLAITFSFYAAVATVVLIAKGHASRGTLGISMGAR